MTRSADTARVRLGRGFHLMFAAAGISALGDGIGLTALPLLAASLSPEPLPVSMVFMAGRLPWLVFGLVAGAIADRCDRLRLMWGSDLFRTVLLAGLVLGVMTHSVGIVALCVFAFVLGSAGTLFDSAAQAMIPVLVPLEDEPLQRANGRLYGARIVGDQLAGPAAGGALFAVAAPVPFALDALSFAGSAVLLGRIRGRYRPERGNQSSSGSRSLWRDIGEGVRWLSHHRLLRTLTLLAAMTNMTLTAGLAVLVILARERLHLSGAGYGLLLAGAALGGLAASITGHRVAARLEIATTIRSAVILVALGTAGVGMAANAVVCGIALAATSYAVILLNVASSPLRQMLVPDALRGRVISASRVLALGAAPLGAAMGGLVADTHGIQAPFLVGAALLVGSTLMAWRTISSQTIEAARAEART